MDELYGSKALFDQIPWHRFEDALVLDGNSTDGTREFFESKGIRVVSQKNTGLGNAVIEALAASTGEAVVFFHPDGNMNPDDTLKFRPLFEQGYEFVVASRMMKGGYNEEDIKWIKSRKWANIVFGWIASVLWRKDGRYKASDPVNGFRGVTKSAFERMAINATDCSVDYQMIIRAYKRKIKLIEFPTIERSRIAGETRFKSIPTGIREVRMLMKEIFE
jgi:glycosyltransferase involved in cell wall biosynthesis